MVFSKEGASPDPAKVHVKAIKEAEPLCNAKGLHSLLFTVQNNARFIESYTPVEGASLLFTRVFNRFGIPEEKSDNGPPLNGSKFSNFAQEQGFLHCKVTTAWAEANGDSERFMQTLKKSPKIARLERKPIRQVVKKTIGNYHAMPHPVTKQSLDQLTLGRELCRKLPKRIVSTQEVSSGQTWRWDVSKKKLMKEYADRRRKINAWESSIVIGDTVLLKQNRAYKLTPTYDPSPYSVIGVKGLWSQLKEGEKSKPRTCHIAKYLSIQGRRSMTCCTGQKWPW